MLLCYEVKLTGNIKKRHHLINIELNKTKKQGLPIIDFSTSEQSSERDICLYSSLSVVANNNNKQKTVVFMI